jgi:hypothetical protein
MVEVAHQHVGETPARLGGHQDHPRHPQPVDLGRHAAPGACAEHDPDRQALVGEG